MATGFSAPACSCFENPPPPKWLDSAGSTLDGSESGVDSRYSRIRWDWLRYVLRTEKLIFEAQTS